MGHFDSIGEPYRKVYNWLKASHSDSLSLNTKDSYLGDKYLFYTDVRFAFFSFTSVRGNIEKKNT